MEEMITPEINLIEVATAYHGAESDHVSATQALQRAQQAMIETRPQYFAGLVQEHIGKGRSVNSIATEIKDETGRSVTATERDVTRVIVMVATGWDDAQTVSETPNIGRGNAPGIKALKEAVAGKNKTDSRKAVRALYAPAPEPAPEPADETGEEPADESAPVDHGTTPGPDSVNIHEDMTAQIVAYLESHEDLNDGVKNLTARAREAYATLGITVKV